MHDYIHHDPIACKAIGCTQRMDLLVANPLDCFHISHDDSNVDCICFECESRRNPYKFEPVFDGALSPYSTARHFDHAVLRLPAVQSMLHRISDDQLHPACLFAYIMRQEDVYVRIPGVNGSPLTFYLSHGKELRCDYASFCRWGPELAREFYADLHGSFVIDEALFEALMKEVPNSLDKRRPLTAAERASVWQKTSGRCSYCGVELTLRGGHANTMHVDHFFPKSKGGACDMGNLMPACPSCNHTKHAKVAAQFYAWGGK